jgi:hypothetical protein
MFFRATSISRRVVIVVLIGIACLTAAGAATVHRLAVTQTSGSGGASTFVQTSASSSALQGEVASSANTSIKIPFGVLGEYNASGSTFGVGVVGISTTGYAVGAEAFDANPAVIALGETTGDGLDAYATGAGNGILASSTSGIGILAMGASGTTSNIGAAGSLPVIAGVTGATGTDLFDGFVNVQGHDFTNFQITFPSASKSAEVNDAYGSDVHTYGDLYVGGNIYASCAGGSSCSELSVEQRTSDGYSVAAFGSHSATPTIEDSGEAQLVNGYAHVSLDPVFARSISTASPYLVFTTPQADSNVLYVTHRTLGGFDVRESKGGRSTLTFDYRIVGKPFGEESKRMTYLKTPGPRRPVSAAIARALAGHDIVPNLAGPRRI